MSGLYLWCVCVPLCIRVSLPLPWPQVPRATDKREEQDWREGLGTRPVTALLCHHLNCASQLLSKTSIQSLKERGRLQPGARGGCHKLRLHNGSIRWYLP